MSNIESAKNNTKEIIAEISEWFTKSKSKDFDDQALVQLIDIAVSCFEKIKGIKFNINRNFSDDADTKIVPGTYVNPIILAMINLLSNCIIHSGLDVDPNIEISVKATDNGFVISVLNSLHELKLSEMNSDFFNNLQISFSSPASLELMRKEGGTGLAKAFHHLKSADTGFDKTRSARLYHNGNEQGIFKCKYFICKMGYESYFFGYVFYDTCAKRAKGIFASIYHWIV